MEKLSDLQIILIYNDLLKEMKRCFDTGNEFIVTDYRIFIFREVEKLLNSI